MCILRALLSQGRVTQPTGELQKGEGGGSPHPAPSSLRWTEADENAGLGRDPWPSTASRNQRCTELAWGGQHGCSVPIPGGLPGGQAWVAPPAGAPAEKELKLENVGVKKGMQRGRGCRARSPPQRPRPALRALQASFSGARLAEPMATSQSHASCSHGCAPVGKEGVRNAKRPESSQATPKPTQTQQCLTGTPF